ncbi:MAG: antibiotic biosynthesis monooxygenase [Actinomycetota bacterium]|nr:antibiotic biosynthesis monooxygenase [Actinomycetota bacterium]
MLARVARYQVPPERCDDTVRAFQEAANTIAELDGLEHGWFFVDSESGATLTVTVWRDQQALDASEVRAASIRQRAAREVDGEVQAVWLFDVIRQFGTPS